MPEAPSQHDAHALRPVDALVGLILVAAAALAAWLVTGGGDSGPPAPAASPVVVNVGAPIVSAPPPVQQVTDLHRFQRRRPLHVPARWVAGFYPLYGVAARTFGVNWLLLASIHDQETSFSTDRTTYAGLNFAHCCGGSMQFNVTNRPASTWSRVADSYQYGRRPPAYPHATVQHPSIYDDFDAIMAASRLLAADGARQSLDAHAWAAAYDYYGHDATGVTYADQVVARAIAWSQRGLCVNCSLDERVVAAVHAAYAPPAPARR
jgi:hypothetical protein